MELCAGGSLNEILSPRIEERSVALVLRELLKALAYLHESGKIHRDVKVKCGTTRLPGKFG